MPTVNEVLSQLKSMTNEKMYAHNIKFGAGENQYGVKMGDIRNIANKIKSDHELALELWKTGNMEARLLACLIVQPKKLSRQQLDEMVKSLDFTQVADWFASYVLKEHPLKEEMMDEWLQSSNKWANRLGWSILAGRIAKHSEGVDASKLLTQLEKEMPKAVPEVQWTMNTALAHIGIHHPAHRQRALDIGNKLGIYKDYPVSKGCTSPFAPIWINEMVKRAEGVKG
jgi:3-methyladenine DNA glycosylase AlkD